MISGRQFEQTEALDSYNPVTIISYQTWQNVFHGDKNILDTKVVLNGVSFKVIGVTNRSFIEPEIYVRGRKTQMWLPWDYNKYTEARESLGG
jgi:hypothetical protein